jgi:hypothetical protein
VPERQIYNQSKRVPSFSTWSEEFPTARERPRDEAVRRTTPAAPTRMAVLSASGTFVLVRKAIE